MAWKRVRFTRSFGTRVARYGSMAIIGGKGEKLDGVIGRISKTIVQDI